MERNRWICPVMRALVLAGLVASSPALLAHPPGTQPPGAANPHAQKNGPGSMPIYIAPGHYFTEQQRTQIHAYYARRFHHGHCPPGLAKKHNGCMPPGQLRQWNLGHPLPASLTVYTVPQTVISILGQPPRGYRYVRVANDLLLMADGTHIVVDAIKDITGG